MSLSAEAAEFASIEALHRQFDEPPDAYCSHCGQDWPCREVRVVAELRAARAENEKLRDALTGVVLVAEPAARDARASTALVTCLGLARSGLSAAAAVGSEEAQTDSNQGAL